MRCHHLGFVVVAFIATCNIHATVQAVDLQPVEVVLSFVGKGAAAKDAVVSNSARLLSDIGDFRRKSGKLPPDEAAAAWLTLWDRARQIDPARASTDYDAYDMSIGAPVGLRSVIGALPSPEAWPALRRQAQRRAEKKPDDASATGLQLVAEILMHDTVAMQKTLAHFERLAQAGSPAEREARRASITMAQTLIYKLYGSREEIAEGFRSSVDGQASMGYGFVDIPDLVGLLGPDRAEALLSEVMRKPVSLQISQGEATRALARKVALSEIDALRKPQWGLVDNVGSAALYEAMQKRFDPVAGVDKDAALEESADGFDYNRRQADLYYFLDLVIAGRHEEAERAMVRATGHGIGFSVPKQAMAELIRSGNNEAVYAYLNRLLERRPQLPAWDVYLEQAAYLGHAKDARVLLDRVMKRSDLPPYLRTELQAKRLDAALAADQIDEAGTGFRSLLAVPPSLDDDGLAQRSAAAVRLASLGRVLNRTAWSDLGFGFARAAIALPTNAKSDWRPPVLRDLLAELRRQNRGAEAQAIALTELERDGDPRNAGFAALVAEPAKRAALVELAGLYDAAGRSADVVRMLDEVGTWGARDLQAVMVERDSLGTPLGLMAARALKASGNGTAARASVSALLDQMPGYDPAYQLFLDLDFDHSIEELDRRYSRDQFEERPLIWKASALRRARQYDAAEATIRQAIAIDPSDGEQGPNDRLRAYAVLADVVEAKGDAKAAQTYRSAVSAIRVSEQADEMRKLGLFQRAFAAYRAALGEFSDAYCIQSRLAVQLGKLGFHDEALKHYRRAFELMPDSFGRVESHCFGCESVFAGPSAQAIAEQVFSSLVKQGSVKPQAPYMLAYLRKEQGRYDEAVVLFKQAIALDHEYLNAWKHLYELGDKTYIDADERDVARLRLFDLDPLQLHVTYQLNEVADLSALWRALARFESEQARTPGNEQVYRLARSAHDRDETLAKMPADTRVQLERYVALQEKINSQAAHREFRPSLGNHALLMVAVQLMGTRGGAGMDD